MQSGNGQFGKQWAFGLKPFLMAEAEKQREEGNKKGARWGFVSNNLGPFGAPPTIILAWPSSTIATEPKDNDEVKQVEKLNYEKFFSAIPLIERNGSGKQVQVVRWLRLLELRIAGFFINWS